MNSIWMKYQKIRKDEDDHYIIDSKVLVSEVNDLLGLDIDDEDIDTIGGWILTENYEAKQGDIIDLDTYTFKIIEMEEHHIKYVEVTKIQVDEESLESVESLVHLKFNEKELSAQFH